MSADIVLTILAPPSTNRMYRNFGGRMVKSTEYRAWKDQQAENIAHQLGGAFLPGYFAVAMLLPASRMDLDNRCKPLLDAMQAAGVYRDDKLCMSLKMTVDHAREPGSVLVHLWVAEAPPKKSKAKKLKMAVPVQPLREMV